MSTIPVCMTEYVALNYFQPPLRNDICKDYPPELLVMNVAVGHLLIDITAAINPEQQC